MSQQDELRNRFDVNNTDKYYRSGAASVFAGQPVDSTTMKPGESIAPGPPTNPASLADLDDKNTDRYYRSKDRKPTPQQVAALKAGRPGATRQRIGDVPVNGMATVRSRVPGELMVAAADEIDGAVHAAVNQVLSGPVSIHVFGDNALVMRLRTRLEMLVTRETITEDQYRDIAIHAHGPEPVREMVRETRTPDEIYGAPAATGEGRDTPMLVDPMDFLKADDADEETIPEAPAPVEVVDDFLHEDEPAPTGAPSGFLSAVTQPAEAAEVDDLFDLPAEDKKIETVDAAAETAETNRLLAKAKEARPSAKKDKKKNR